MIDHMSLVVSDINVSEEFYRSTLAAIGYELLVQLPASASRPAASRGFGEKGKPDFWLREGAPNHPPIHIAFRANSRELVDAFYEAALKAGGRDNGKPGVRPHYHASYYGAFVLDPDGHNIEAVCHQPVTG
ncbi:MAG: VOC family protein [Cystobacterineae bacterium]|nr:VOC family protein [Cystobacterineae bacterium]